MSRRTARGDARRERRAVGRWLAGVARDRRPDLARAVSGALVRQCGFLAVPVILQFAIDDSVADGDPAAAWRWAGVLLAAAVLQFAGMCVWDWYANAADARAGAALRGRLLGRLWTVPPDRDDDSDGSPTGAGDLVMRNGRDIDIVRVWVHGLPSWAVIGLTIAVLVPGILTLDPLLLVVALGTAPCLVALNLVYPRRFERASDATARAHGARADVVDHLLRSAVTTRGIGAEHVLRDRHHERSAALVGHTVRTGGILARWTALGEGIPAVATAVGLLVGAVAVSDNRLTVGGLVAFSGWMGTIGIAVQIGLTRLSQTVDARVAARRLLAVLGTDLIGANAPRAGTPAAVPPTGPRELRIDGVTTRSGGAPVTLAVPVGAVLAITGPTASGKSTLLRVLAGREPAVTGTVTLRDVPLREWPADARARSVVLVPQRPVVMAGTVRENLELGDPRDPDTLWAALRATGLDRDFAAGGLATVIGDGATSLSGGQIQRLALARALVADPLVLLLDDVTSAVDADTEAVVVAALRDVARDRILVVTGHRPAMLSTATHTVSLSAAAAPVTVGGRP